MIRLPPGRGPALSRRASAVGMVAPGTFSRAGAAKTRAAEIADEQAIVAKLGGAARGGSAARLPVDLHVDKAAHG